MISKKKPHFLLVNWGQPLKSFTFDTLRAKNLTVIVACPTPPPKDWGHPPDQILITDIFDPLRLLADVITLMATRHIKFAGVGTFDEFTVTQAADVAAALGLAGLPPGAARRSSNNKILMRSFCRDAGIPSPRFEVLHGLDEKKIRQAARRIGLPCVLKPNMGSSSLGTIKLEKGTDLASALAEIRRNADREELQSSNGAYLVEEYLPGPVISVDGLVQNGKIMIAGSVEFIMGPEPRFYQVGCYTPSTLSPSALAPSVAMTKRIVSALGLDNCGFHCELRLTPKGPRLMEIGARPVGGVVIPAYQKAMGFDLGAKLIDIWLGRKVTLKATTQRFVIQKAVYPTGGGTVTGVTGLRAARKLRGVWRLTNWTKPGEKIRTYPQKPKPIYSYYLVARSPQALQRLADQLESTVKFSVK